MAGTRTSRSRNSDKTTAKQDASKRAAAKRTAAKQAGSKMTSAKQAAQKSASATSFTRKAQTKKAAGGSSVGKRMMMVMVAVACVVGVGRIVQGHATTVPSGSATAASLSATQSASQTTMTGAGTSANAEDAPIYSVGVPDQAPIPQDALRLRVIANSDSASDQSVKLRVRDAIVVKVGELLQNIKDAQQAKAIVTANLPQLQDLANQVLNQQGFTYKAVADVGEVPFPTKIYGNKVYPAGNYEALRITLGSGQGQNWWCVLFPPLCFVDITDGDAVPNTGGFPDLPPLEEVKVPTASGSQTEVQVRMASVDYGEELYHTVKHWIHG